MLDFGFVGFGFAGETTINATADSSLSAFKEAKYGDRVYEMTVRMLANISKYIISLQSDMVIMLI